MRFIIVLALLISFPALAAENTVPVTKTSDAVKERPLRADAGLSKAEDQIAEGKYMQAIDTLGGVLQRRPGDADALAYSGFAWMELGETEKAAESIDTALRADPRHLGANALKAELFLAAGEADRAREQLQVIRLVCAGADCAELDRVQGRLNAHKKAEQGQ